MKGRKPKPTALRIIEGNREHRTIHPELEPKPDKIAPSCPRELKGDERKAWRYLVRELTKMQVIASSDRAQMVGYCDAWGRWTKAKRMIAEAELKGSGIPGELQLSSKGGFCENVWLRISNRALVDLIKYGAELGLNPIQRTRVKLDKPESQSRRGKLLA